MNYLPALCLFIILHFHQVVQSINVARLDVNSDLLVYINGQPLPPSGVMSIAAFQQLFPIVTPRGERIPPSVRYVQYGVYGGGQQLQVLYQPRVIHMRIVVVRAEVTAPTPPGPPDSPASRLVSPVSPTDTTPTNTDTNVNNNGGGGEGLSGSVSSVGLVSTTTVSLSTDSTTSSTTEVVSQVTGSSDSTQPSTNAASTDAVTTTV